MTTNQLPSSPPVGVLVAQRKAVGQVEGKDIDKEVVREGKDGRRPCDLGVHGGLRAGKLLEARQRLPCAHDEQPCACKRVEHQRAVVAYERGSLVERYCQDNAASKAG